MPQIKDSLPNDVQQTINQVRADFNECLQPYEQPLKRAKRNFEDKKEFEVFHPNLAAINDALNPLYSNSKELKQKVTKAEVDYYTALPVCIKNAVLPDKSR